MSGTNGMQLKDIKDGFVLTYKQSVSDLISSLGVMWKDGLMCDVTLKTNGGKISAHKVILAASCEYFRVMFSGSMLESQSHEIPLPSFDHACLSLLVKFFYTGKIQVLDEQLVPMVEMTDMLQLTKLKEVFLLRLKMNVTSSNCLGLYMFAEQVVCGPLKTTCSQYIQQGFPNVIKSEEFLELPIDVLCQVLSYQDINLENKKEAMILSAALRWLKANIDGDKEVVSSEELNRVLSCVRWHHISEEAVLKLEVKTRKTHPELWEKVLVVKDARLAEENFIGARTCESFSGVIHAIGGFLQSRTGPSCPRLKSAEMLDIYEGRWAEIEDLPFETSYIYSFQIRYSIYCIAAEHITDSAGLSPSSSQYHLLQFKGEWNNLSYCLSQKVKTELFELLDRGATLLYCPYLHSLLAVSNRGVHKFKIVHDVERDTITMLDGVQLSEQLPFDDNLRLYTLASYEGKLYIIGGTYKLSQTEQMPTAEMWCLDMANKEWARRASMASPRSSAVAVVLDGHIFVMGGSNMFRLKTVEKYYPKSNTWMEQPSMRKERTHFGAAVTMGCIYVMGGKSYSYAKGGARKVLRNCEMFDPANPEDGWKEKEPMVQARCMFGAV